MSAIRDDQLPEVSACMNAIWKTLIKPCYNPEEGDSYWNDVFVRIELISKRYCQNDKRLQQILIGFEKGLEQVHGDCS